MLIQNAMRTPDGIILNSLTESDSISHIDESGFKYLVSGGLSYTRVYSDGKEEDLTLRDTDSISTVKEKMLVKVEGKWKLVRECSREELQAVLTSKNLPSLKKHVVLSYLK